LEEDGRWLVSWRPGNEEEEERSEGGSELIERRGYGPEVSEKEEQEEREKKRTRSLTQESRFSIVERAKSLENWEEKGRERTASKASRWSARKERKSKGRRPRKELTR